MQEKSQALSDALQKLEMFTGICKGTEKFLEGAGPGAGMDLQTQGVYEWLPGGYFMTDNGRLDFGGGSLEVLRIIRYDEKAGMYVMHAFDSIGYVREYKGNVSGNEWHFSGELERVTLTFSDDNSR